MKQYPVKFPYNIDLDQICFFLDYLQKERNNNAVFWKGKDLSEDNIETVFGRTKYGDTVIGTIDITEEVKKLITWLQALTPAE